MSVQTLMTSANYAFGQTPDNVRFQDDFYSALNDSQNDICNRKWGFLRTTGTVTTVDGTRSAALPSDFGKMYDIRGAVVITSPSANLGDIIQLMPYDQWKNEYYDDGSEEGTPTYCYLMGSLIYFSPVPDAAYTVSIIYYKRPTEIADTSTALTIPTEYMELLKKNLWRRLQDAGYSSVTELQISDNDIQKLMYRAASDDAAKYGTMTFNLNSTDYQRRTN